MTCQEFEAGMWSAIDADRAKRSVVPDGASPAAERERWRMAGHHRACAACRDLFTEAVAAHRTLIEIELENRPGSDFIRAALRELAGEDLETGRDLKAPAIVGGQSRSAAGGRAGHGPRRRRLGWRVLVPALGLAGLAFAVWMVASYRSPTDELTSETLSASRGSSGAAAGRAIAKMRRLPQAFPLLQTARSEGRPRISFEATASEATEGGEAEVAVVVVSGEADSPIAFTLSAEEEREAAAGCPRGRLSAVQPGPVALAERVHVFPPGSRRVLVRLSLPADGFAQLDETVPLRLRSHEAEVLQPGVVHTLTVRDAERSRVLDVVRDFGAVGQRGVDDTEALQRAMNAAAATRGAIVYLPPGTYDVRLLTLPPGLTLQGSGATLRRIPQPPFSRNNGLLQLRHSGFAHAPPGLIRGVTFDGSFVERGAGQPATRALLHIGAHGVKPGRVRAIVRDCHFRNEIQTALDVGTNAAVTVQDVTVKDVPTALRVRGGNTNLEVCGLVASQGSTPTRVHVAPQYRGYGRTSRVDADFARMDLRGGALQVDVDEGSTIVAAHVTGGALTLRSPRSRVRISDSDFHADAAAGTPHGLHCPSDVLLEGLRLSTDRVPFDAHDAQIAALAIDWTERCPALSGQTVILRNSVLGTKGAFEPTDRLYAIATRAAGGPRGNVLAVEGGRIAPDFPEGFLAVGAGAWVFDGVRTGAPLALSAGPAGSQVVGLAESSGVFSATFSR